MTVEQLNSQLREYIRDRRVEATRVTRSGPPPLPPIAMTRLPASADDLLLYDAALRLGLQENRTAADLARIRRAAARHPGDPFARRVLARAEAFHGEGEAADRLLDALIAESPNDAELLYARGMRYMQSARAAADPAPDHRRAASWFARAHRADPDHFPTLYQYAESLRSQPTFVSENTENILLLAAQLAPQVDEVRLLAGEMLLLRAKYDEAKAMLMPVALAPHANEASKSARAMIEMAEARRPVSRAEIRAALERLTAPQ